MLNLQPPHTHIHTHTLNFPTFLESFYPTQHFSFHPSALKNLASTIPTDFQPEVQTLRFQKEVMVLQRMRLRGFFLTCLSCKLGLRTMEYGVYSFGYNQAQHHRIGDSGNVFVCVRVV
ncbi:hypothetical protein PoB_006190800 [Plakobranchus ocellatus]|uniref:Uncharacterized protein n=1 Tax=Plakobranchus ocellatus TaxID=259542 RepID=A0AAV4CU46_9GAST|nr:hypothetical protein PoB_006190800 [Plakobranchus ocellatus]